MTESEFSDRVADLARTFGWMVAAFRPARTAHGWRTPVRYDGKGFPDLTLAHFDTQRVIFAELKTNRGTLTGDQVRWVEVLDAYVWRPADWDDIVEILTFGRGTTTNMKETP